MLRVVPILLLCLIGIQGCFKPQPSKPNPPIQEASEPRETRNYVNFESAHVRTMATSSDGKYLYVTNTQDNRVDILSRDENGLLLPVDSVPVGLEPVALAIHNDELWVVNHLSDSISIIDLTDKPFVKRTLLVGDEPRDIIFANDKAFITTAHRGQHRTHPSLSDVDGAGDPKLFDGGVGRADIWVFETPQSHTALGGKPLKIINLFGDTPRALALSPDGNTLYAAVFNSGNQTTAVHEAVVCDGFDDDGIGNKPCTTLDGEQSPNGMTNGQLPGGRTGPSMNAAGDYQPWTAMIVKYDQTSGQWRDTKGRNFSNGIRFNLPDLDVFSINTQTLEPVDAYPYVGTTLFNMAVNPANGLIYVSNTDANNATRFEGAGTFAGSTVQGHIAKTQITVIDPVTKTVRKRHLNRHIDYRVLKASPATKAASLSTPTRLQFSPDGKKVYLAAMGSNKVAVFDTSDLENDALWDNQGEEFNPVVKSQAYFTGLNGPSDLLLDQSLLYVFNRFSHSLSVLDAQNGSVLQELPLFNPEPKMVSSGRFMLYDANRSSSNGESSCASCHIFADSDQLAWNLGNPDATTAYNPQPFPTFKFSELGCDFVGPEEPSCQLLQIINGTGERRDFAALKGPMFSQSLRGMSTHGHMHWRGDRANGYFGIDTDQHLDEKTSFKNFIVAFEGLLGMDIDLPANHQAANKSAEVIALEEDMASFADFILSIQMPPNPIRPLSGDLSPSAQQGKHFFVGERRSDGLAFDDNKNGPEADGVNCEGCHGLDPAQGFYGTRGESAHGGEAQIFKVPQLRNLYTRVGMFGLPDREGFLPSHTKAHQGDQIRGFGFLHDDATDLLFNFLKGGVFDNGELPCPPGADERHGCLFNQGVVGINNDQVRQSIVDYLMEFDSDLAPIVGQQITLDGGASAAVISRIALFEMAANQDFVSKILGGEVKACDLVATGIINNERKGFLYDPITKHYQSDNQTENTLSSADIKAIAQSTNNALTFTCAVPGRGYQMALDRDNNGIFNRNEG
ncbi:MAG: hypothetical protein OXE99_14005 [Cellvibrionales bacterium]|nr:hypothetical protein [Cellvibrionales bacterium]